MKTPTGRREATKAHNRQTILAAARKVFAEIGFAGATVRDVIRATPLASGTFYNYFRSKEELYQALCDEEALAIRPALRAARQAAATAQDFLSASLRAYFALAAQSAAAPLGPAEIIRLRMDSPEMLAGFTELRADIEAAIAQGVLPALDADFLGAAITGVAFELAYRVREGADAAAAEAFATALLLDGISGAAKNV